MNKMTPIKNLAPKIDKMAPIQNVASKMNKMAPIQNVAPKNNKMAPIQCLPQYSPIQPSAAQYSPVQPNIAQYSSVHSSYRVLKWPNLVSKRPVKVPRWPIYHYYGFDCTKLQLLSRDSIAASQFENIFVAAPVPVSEDKMPFY